MKPERLSLTTLGVAFGVATVISFAWNEPVRADCVSECQASTYCDSDMSASGECGRLLNDCYISTCSSYRSYGAIAYDAESGAVGWSYEFDNAEAAEEKALTGCSESSAGCKVVLDFWNTCAALAVSESGKFATALGGTRGRAETEAVAVCGQDSGENCEIKAWSCTK